MSGSKTFVPAARLNLPGYPFAELERKAAALRASGRRLHDLSIGDPDLPPPAFVVEAVKRALDDPRAHIYPSSRGDRDVRQAVAVWFKGRFGVQLDPDTQVCITIGGKEGLAQIARAVVNPGDVVAFPDPGYPVFRRAGCRVLDARPRPMTLDSEHGFLPDLTGGLAAARLLYINYPHNPTGAIAPLNFQRQVALLADEDPTLTIASDMAYSEMTFGDPSHSLLEFTSHAIEFHSLSKMANATGYRVGFAVGSAERIAALVRIKEEMDSGAPLPFQRALQALLESYDGSRPPAEVQQSRVIYADRRQRLGAAIRKAGHRLFESNATFYLWFKVGEDELPYISRLVEEGVLLTPGSGFGETGRGWVRASVTAAGEDVDAAAAVIERLG